MVKKPDNAGAAAGPLNTNVMMRSGESISENLIINASQGEEHFRGSGAQQLSMKATEILNMRIVNNN